MEDIRTRPLSAIEPAAWRNWLPQTLALIYLLAATVAFVVAPINALRWMNQPFLGNFVEPTMVFNSMGPWLPEDAQAWNAHQQGMTFAYQLKAVDGQPVRSAGDLASILSAKRPGDRVTVTVKTPQGAEQSLTVLLSAFPPADRFAYFYISYFIGLVYLGSAFWVFAVRRSQPSGRVFAVFGVSVALALGLIFDTFTTHAFSNLWILALALSGGMLATLALYFPHETPLLHRYVWLRIIGIAVALLIGVNGIIQMARADNPLAYAWSWRIAYIFVGAAMLFTLVWMGYRRSHIRTPNEREQLKLMLIAGLLSFSPIALWFFITSVLQTPFTPYLLLPLAVFPLMSGYIVQRYRMLTADYILSRALQIGLLTVLVIIGYAALAAGLGLLLAQFVPGNSPLVVGLTFFVIALVFVPLRDRSQHLIDAVFFRGKRAYQERLQTFSGDLTRMVDLPGILRTLRRYVEETLSPQRLHIFVYDPLSDQYVTAPDLSGHPTSDLRFPVTSGLAIRLADKAGPFVLSEFTDLPAILDPERSRLLLLGALAFVPLPGRQRLSGWLALGPRLSGEPYTSQQVGYLEALCDQAALAIERAQVVANMENRVREMNVLARVAQGVNITLTLDDILELVYAQTTSIISADDFHIMLYDRDTDTFEFGFYLENDDRVDKMERHPIPGGQALEQDVIRSRRPVLTDDYGRECQRRGMIAGRRTLYAWMGVPLNAGAETIGALSLGNADPSEEYTLEQQNLLQAVADQVAGAIVKARLLLETQRRARQLTTLNEVTRQLTSTLETEPLLQNILNSAVEILNCEAGSLLLLDIQTDELVFRSVVSPVAGNLLDRRMPADRGVAGKCLKTREPIIVNDVSKYPEWFPAPDKQTGFLTRAILVIPLMIKEKVIGVIEVLNKKDGSAFTRDDLDLLAAFAAQAGVAIENARLYTLTDQALAERVEELSVMQRIDRELNTSLEPTRAMRITLEWAMRQSGSAAGLVGVLSADDTKGIQVMASQGYANELEPYENELLPTHIYHLEEPINDGLPVRRTLMAANDGKGLLQNARSQAIIPIRRETTTIGLILLENTSETTCSDETITFLSRLSDHASIAISNAQLYTAVQQANLAKSDFVSFVAHELKNPMTSVKGYTELISAGAVGPVNDVQANFLATIRSNIERMNTLVSDLNDMSKIEVGRLRLEFKPVKLSEALEEVIRSIRKQVEEKQQTLNLKVPPDMPMLWSDRVRLVQVLVNLVSNAHKYTPAGGVLEVSAEACKNQWDPNGAAEVVHIAVKDNGIGINEEDQKKIFQKFFRSDDPKTREVTGTGLGLNITKSLVELQGGKIWFESEYRKGTTFHFTVPVSE